MEVAGIVQEVNFDSGGDLKAGDPIIKLIDADDVAKLHTLEASRDLAKTSYDRDQAQLQRQLISQAAFDVTAASYNAAANVATVNLTRNTGYLLPRSASSNFWGPRDMQLGIKFLF